MNRALDRALDRALAAERVSLTYPGASGPILTDLSVTVEPGAMTVIVGPNACGKSTLLRAYGRVLRPDAGQVTLDGARIGDLAPKAFARRVALLPQSATAPDDITAGDLVARGRFPHQGLLRQWSAEDEAAVTRALERTDTMALADRAVAELSGGQRQRVWIAMALAQETDILLLDEPTTYLDLAHQLEILDLCRELIDDHGKTIVAVLHDLNHACRYADRIVAMRDGRVVANGSPAETITAELVRDVFGVPCRIIPDPVTHAPLVVPEEARPRRRRNPA
ncbi:ABC transporter ATP-binding protein [Streptomyces mayteni]